MQQSLLLSLQPGDVAEPWRIRGVLERLRAEDAAAGGAHALFPAGPIITEYVEVKNTAKI